MRLYYANNSPYARKVRAVLAERGIPHEAVVVNLDKPDAGFVKANPNLKVPCLVDGEQALFESNVIIDYLLQVPGGRPAPEQPALARTLTRPEHHWDDLLMLTTIELLLDSASIAYHYQREGIQPEQSLSLRRELSRIQSELDWIEARVTPEGYIPGTFSIQDLNLVVTLLWMDFRKPASWHGHPNLEALVRRHEVRASFQTTKPAP
ncbi:MAG TPA: glutathione S-transferase family protein [bacterium]